MSIIDSFIAVEQKIDGISKAMNDTTIPEAQRKNAFIEYKAYLDKAKTKMFEAKASGDAVIIQKADEVIKKIDACLVQFGQSMAIAPGAGADDFVDEVVIHEENNTQHVIDNTAVPNEAANSIAPTMTTATVIEIKAFFIKYNGSFVYFSGTKEELNIHINKIMGAEIAAGFIPEIWEGVKLPVKRKLTLDF